MASQGIFGRTVFPAMKTRVALTSDMFALYMFKHPSLEFCSIITVSTSPYKASHISLIVSSKGAIWGDDSEDLRFIVLHGELR